jgi:hypothetical protein
MSRFLRYARFAALLSGIIAELLPELLVEFRKRDDKVLVVTKVTNVDPQKGSIRPLPTH